LATGIALSAGFAIMPSMVHAQAPTPTPFDKLPDWSGTWAMMGGTVSDRATQTGQGGSVTLGVREHLPYNTGYEKK
jgi:hypothetical protein